jgi:glycosyltransferase involved in cell wall biosynthesis
MRVLLCHNFYQQPGGEDQCFAATARLLERRGHDVISFTLHNDSIKGMNPLAAAAKTLWNRDSYHALRRLIRERRPDIAEFHNTFPLISPAAYYACHAEGVAVVQTLHNYRLGCPGALLYRDGQPCEDCLGRTIAWPAVRHGCYRGSRSGTAVVAGLLATHRALGTWNRQVDAYIALNRFSAEKYVRAGLDPARIHVNPNFLESDPELGRGDGGFVLFAGRLTEEKGIATLLAAWKRLRSDITLKIVGDGPVAIEVAAAAAADPRIQWLGRVPNDAVMDLMGQALCVVIPSRWYEVFNRTIIESFARGTPVVASRLGSLEANIEDGRTGLLFRPDNPDDLAACIDRLAGRANDTLALRHAARRTFETSFTADVNHDRLIAIYHAARSRFALQRNQACPSNA